MRTVLYSLSVALLLGHFFILQGLVCDIEVPPLRRSWFPPPQVLEQLPQEVHASS